MANRRTLSDPCLFIHSSENAPASLCGARVGGRGRGPHISTWNFHMHSLGVKLLVPERFQAFARFHFISGRRGFLQTSKLLKSECIFRPDIFRIIKV
jgi:hypothetical protein